jgi:tetratricopeptide (TPR) repeat protein
LPEEGDAAKQMRVYIQIEQVETYYRLWKLDDVEKLGQQALKLAREIDDKTSIAYIIAHIGLNTNRRGYYDESKKYLLEADTLVDDIQDKTIQIFILRQLGNVDAAKPQTATKALGYFERSLAIAREINDLDGEASAYNAIGNAYMTLNRLAESIEVYEKGVTIAHEIGDDSMLSVLLMNIGLLYYFKRDYQKSRQTYQEALHISEKIGAGQLNVQTSINQTRIQLGVSYDEMIPSVKLCLEIALADDSLVNVNESVEALIHLFTREGKYARAAELLGVWYASPLFEASDPLIQIHTNLSLATIKQHLSEAEVDAAIERGKQLDLMTVGKMLLTEL